MKRARTIPADAPAALVIGDKVTAIDPANPVHLDWLELMLGLLREKHDATKPYPPPLDEVVSQGDLDAWAEGKDWDKTMPTRAWNLLWKGVGIPKYGRWDITCLGVDEKRAQVIPIGLIVGPFLYQHALRSANGKARQFVMAFLKDKYGLRIGMNTRAWLNVREKTIRRPD